MEPWYQSFDAFARKKSVQIPLAIIMVIWLTFLIHGWIHFVRQSNTWDVEHKWSAALRESEKVPPGLDRAEDLLARLKRIDTGYAPDDLKRAVTDYITAFERAIYVGKAGESTVEFDLAMDAAKQRMVDIAKKYDK
jgi:hypothetical protein